MAKLDARGKNSVRMDRMGKCPLLRATTDLHIEDDGTCTHCEDRVDEMAEHLLFHCEAWTKQRLQPGDLSPHPEIFRTGGIGVVQFLKKIDRLGHADGPNSQAPA